MNYGCTMTGGEDSNDRKGLKGSEPMRFKKVGYRLICIYSNAINN